jgi:AcrR family transcriptional regulator
MTDENPTDQVKTVYAHFGLALYLAQVLEHGLANALMCTELIPRRAGNPVPRKKWEAEFDAFIEQQFKHTLGRLIQHLDSTTPVPDDLEELLTAALVKRNFLAHHYFRERAEAFMSHRGREEMIAELQEAQKLFERADDRLNQVITPLCERYGLTDDKLRPFMDEYMSRFSHDL